MDCIVCNHPLPNVAEGYNQPQGGTEFATSGHYGSTVTDDVDGTQHVINVCDGCLLIAMARGACMVVPPKQRDKRRNRQCASRN